jgi:hypothetical protein
MAIAICLLQGGLGLFIPENLLPSGHSVPGQTAGMGTASSPVRRRKRAQKAVMRDHRPVSFRPLSYGRGYVAAVPGGFTDRTDVVRNKRGICPKGLGHAGYECVLETFMSKSE